MKGVKVTLWNAPSESQCPRNREPCQGPDRNAPRQTSPTRSHYRRIRIPMCCDWNLIKNWTNNWFRWSCYWCRVPVDWPEFNIQCLFATMRPTGT